MKNEERGCVDLSRRYNASLQIHAEWYDMYFTSLSYMQTQRARCSSANNYRLLFVVLKYYSTRSLAIDSHRAAYPACASHARACANFLVRRRERFRLGVKNSADESADSSCRLLNGRTKRGCQLLNVKMKRISWYGTCHRKAAFSLSLSLSLSFDE